MISTSLSHVAIFLISCLIKNFLFDFRVSSSGTGPAIMASVVDIARYVMNFTVFFITNCYGLFAYVMWTMTLLPLRVLSPSVYWQIESFLFKGLHSFVVLWMASGRYGGKKSCILLVHVICMYIIINSLLHIEISKFQPQSCYGWAVTNWFLFLRTSVFTSRHSIEGKLSLPSKYMKFK